MSTTGPKIYSNLTTDMYTVAAVFMSRHAHDMIATRKRRFLDAAIFFLPVLVLEVPSVRTRTFFLISYHDILNRRKISSIGRISSL
jgi:hypothetical protein